MSKYFIRKETTETSNTFIKVFEGTISSSKLYVFNVMVDKHTSFQIVKDYWGKIDNTEEAISEALKYEDLYMEISSQQAYDLLNKSLMDIIF